LASVRQAYCRFEYLKEDDGSSSVDSEFNYLVGDENKSAHLAYDKELKPIQLVPKLHALMKQHTGGEWTVFTLTLTVGLSVMWRLGNN